jgi:hypothetical protein
MKLGETVIMAKIEPTPEMVKFFKDRTDAHVAKTIAAAKILNANFPYLKLSATSHDASKYVEPEYSPYIWLTEYHRCKNLGLPFVYPEGMKEKVDVATLHHIKTNKHHPESWLNINNMPNYYLAEMVCDWCAMSQEKGNSLKGWADSKVGSKWKFNPEQTKFIYKMIEVLELNSVITAGRN